MTLQVKTYVAGANLKDLTVDVQSVDLVVPAASFFQVEGLSEDVYLNGGFLWTFEDSDGASYDKLRTGHPWRSNGKSMAIGPKASRVFQTAETVRWTVDIIYQGEWKRVTNTLDIAEQSTIYSDSNTFYFSPSGTWAGEAVGATNQYTDWATLIAALPLTGEIMIKVNRGENFEVDGAGRIRRPNLTITTYGTGARPQLSLSSTEVGTLEILDLEVGKTKVIGLDLRGGWDSTTETRSSTENKRGINYYPKGSDIIDGKLLIHDCYFDGLEHNVYLAGPEIAVGDEVVNNRLAILSENEHTNRSNFGIFAFTMYNFGVIGCNIGQDVDAMGGGSNAREDPDHNKHGPIRAKWIANAVYWANDMFSPHGWSLFNATTPAHQPCIRHLSAGMLGAQSVIAGNLLEGGYHVLQVAKSEGTALTSPSGRHRICSNMFVGSANSSKLIACEYPGTAADNNVMINPGVDPEFFYRAAVGTGDNPAPGGSDADKPISFNGNTIVNLSTEAYTNDIIDTAAFASAGYTNVSEANTAFYAPNLTTGADTSLAPLDATAIITPKYKGKKWFDAPTLDTSYATPSTSGGLYSPDTGSAALGAATDAPVLDFFGNVRGASTAIGAFDAIVS